MVRAYKGLVKEKEALDAVIKSGANPNKSDDTTEDTEESNLAKALKTITDEKARLESMFTEDKKKCLSKIKALEGMPLCKLQTFETLTTQFAFFWVWVKEILRKLKGSLVKTQRKFSQKLKGKRHT